MLSDDPDHLIQFTVIRSDPRTGEVLSFQGAKPHYQVTLLDGLRVYQSPHATNPLEWDALDAPGVLQVMPGGEDGGSHPGVGQSLAVVGGDGRW